MHDDTPVDLAAFISERTGRYTPAPWRIQVSSYRGWYTVGTYKSQAEAIRRLRELPFPGRIVDTSGEPRFHNTEHEVPGVETV